MKITTDQIQKFRRVIQAYYRSNKRDLPWRWVSDSYRVVISELMLQQTQVDRVIPKYEAFLKAFPNWFVLSKATQREVMVLWQGLGYNRRALYLHKMAHIITSRYIGILPSKKEDLVALPGIGPATACAILAFAFNRKVVFIETNIRSVYIDYFFKKSRKTIDDKEILFLIEKTLPKSNFRDWYYALMDYGSYLKKNNTNPSKKSSHYKRAKPFKTSLRFIRGQIIKLLIKHDKLAESFFYTHIDRSPVDIKKCLNQLIKEDLIYGQNNKFIIK